MTRHQMREYAFMLTFERIFNKDSLDEIIETARDSECIELNNQVISLFKGVDDNLQILDAEIEKLLQKSWSINRISKVALSVLRIAIYEIMFCDDIDIDISISEAVKIAEEYTMADDVSFVNGVLSSISKELKANNPTTI